MATDAFTFTASAGQCVYFDALTSQPCDTRLRWRRQGPDGTALFDQWFAATPWCNNGDPGSVPFTNAGTYSIVVCGDTHFTGPSSFRLITPAPVINSQPADQYAARGQSITFHVTAASVVPLQYQWRFNGNILAGQTQDTLVLNDIQIGQSGSYSVFLQDASGPTSPTPPYPQRKFADGWRAVSPSATAASCGSRRTSTSSSPTRNRFSDRLRQRRRFLLQFGTHEVGSAGDRGFNDTWMPVAFESEGIYPFTLLFTANATGQSGLEPRAPEVGNACLAFIIADRASLRLAAAPGRIMPGGPELARLAFTADEAVDSAVLRLVVTDLQGVGSSGIPPRCGSTVLSRGGIGRNTLQPLPLSGTGTLWIHGEPTRSYWLESTRRLGIEPWVRVSRSTLSTRDQAVPGVARADGSQYFRLVAE